MDSKRVKFLAKITEVLEQLNIDTVKEYPNYFGDQEQIFVKDGIKSDFAIQYRFSCNELIKIKELMKCDDIIWTNGKLPGQVYWVFYKLIYENE